jgi:hypothetical protein
MKKDTTFSKYIALIDEVEVGTSITRQYVILMLDLDSHAARTVDTYRKLLENANFLEYNGLGCYRKIRALDHSLMTASKLRAENEKFYNALCIGLKWAEKTNEDIERANRWRRAWVRSCLNADDFIEAYRGAISGEQYGI